MKAILVEQKKSSGGVYAFDIDANGHLILSYDTSIQAPNFSIDSSGHLVYEF